MGFSSKPFIHPVLFVFARARWDKDPLSDSSPSYLWPENYVILKINNRKPFTIQTIIFLSPPRFKLPSWLWPAYWQHFFFSTCSLKSPFCPSMAVEVGWGLIVLTMFSSAGNIHPPQTPSSSFHPPFNLVHPSIESQMLSIPVASRCVFLR